MDPVTGLLWDNFDAGVAIVKQDVLSGYAMLVLFDANVPDSQADYALMTEGLYLIMKSGGDVIYYTPPP
jgi:hypothetical protein